MGDPKRYKQLDIIYEYTQEVVRAKNDSLNRIDVKLSGFIGVLAIIIRLASDLPTNTNWQAILRIVVCIISAAGIVWAVIGLVAKASGAIIHPKDLMSEEQFDLKPKEYDYCPSDYCKAYIIASCIELIDEFSKLTIEKRKHLNLTIFLFVLTIIFYTIAVMFS